MYPSSVDVAIIGAGPNGLGLATYLRKNGVKHRIFGKPMQTWRDMPRNMNLKSLGFATSIPTPDGHPTFPEYCRANGLEDYEPIEFHTFAEYGLKVQRDLVPNAEETLVTAVCRQNDEFVLTLETGERLTAKRVVVAVGQTYFARIPEILKAVPTERVTHTWGPKDFAAYTGKDVVVVGGGSSALETAVLLHEHGANVQVVARSEAYIGGHGPREWERPLIERIRVPISTIGHGRENWVLEHLPWLMHYLPAQKRIPFTRKHLGPAAAWWLRARLDGYVPIKTHTALLEARLESDKVTLRVHEAGVGEYEIEADHVIAGTGYQPDVESLTFLGKDLKRQVQLWDKAPRLSRHFESSVPGLYFIGPIAAESFGPLVRFVAGASYSVRVVAGHLSRKESSLVALVRRVVGASAPARVTAQT